MKEFKKKLKLALNNKLIKFAITGASGLLIDLYVTWILIENFAFNQYAAHVLGFLMAVINNYFVNKYWTFKDGEKKSLKQFILFLALSITGLCLNTGCLYLLITFLKINFYIAKILSVLIVFIWNYTSNSFLTFRKNKNNPEDFATLKPGRPVQKKV